jgi:hypothetical protein
VHAVGKGLVRGCAEDLDACSQGSSTAAGPQGWGGELEAAQLDKGVDQEHSSTAEAPWTQEAPDCLNQATAI